MVRNKKQKISMSVQKCDGVFFLKKRDKLYGVVEGHIDKFKRIGKKCKVFRCEKSGKDNKFQQK